ncbi:dTDP-4-amino-4,6-dideoxygalactose transaminase [Cnuibacter physcomitrellae]|uniref:dTDP-4-amino-4,6-dideoxygalactose transaminase n=1 Tax=Cnuibacter physcomitrellae TaxID=1619308 RepID=UPI002175DC15|nr:dTDP-4-amino-4,6-dideoxygalactose transaminase [Cnuibacter physcomitrellae]MCS5496239.1 dTDP-4-amino-4,6-dideoxygalactose transaminase [Cnuibacter physcomitrellae]
MAGGESGGGDVVFSRPFRAPGELENLDRVLRSDHSHGDGVFTASATARLREITGAGHVLLTTSCTHALEMASMLLDLGPGDEVVLPTFTFPSAATAIVTRGATPVFADIDPRTGNLDPESVAEAVTERTRAISVMHYGGVAADLDALEAIARPRGIPIIEDNAHGLGGVSGGRRLGTEGAFGAQSFHDTKNVHCGEGGALLINDERYVARAEIIREKGTDRSRFLRGAVDKYSWQDAGSSYLPSELNAAVLDAQLAAFDEIQRRRRAVWDAYAAGLADWAGEHGVDTMSATPGLEHSAHLYYLLLPEHEDQQALIAHLKARGVRAAFHYIPLDSAPAGLRYGRRVRPLDRAARFHDRLVRLPLWAGMTDAEVERVVDGVRSFRPR